MKIWEKWTILIIGLITLFASGVSFALAASDYPSGPIEVVVPYGPGGGADIASRAYKDFAAKILGQPIVLVYKVGAAGAMGTAFVANSKPHGYTLIVGSTSSLVTAPLVSKTGYTLDDFAPICGLTVHPLVFAVKDDSPYKTMQDFIQAAKTKKMKFAGTGPLQQADTLVGVLAKLAGVTFIIVPFDSVPEMGAAILGGHADFAVAAGFAGMVGPGKLRIIATSGKQRVEAYADVPTLKELGYPVYGGTYYSLLAPKRTPKEIINKIYEAYKKAAEENREEISKVLLNLRHTMLLLSPEELRKVYQEEYEFQKKNLGEKGLLFKQ